MCINACAANLITINSQKGGGAFPGIPPPRPILSFRDSPRLCTPTCTHIWHVPVETFLKFLLTSLPKSRYIMIVNTDKEFDVVHPFECYVTVTQRLSTGLLSVRIFFPRLSCLSSLILSFLACLVLRLLTPVLRETYWWRQTTCGW